MMLRLPILLLALTPVLAHGQTILQQQDFDGGSNNALVAQTLGLPWTTWTNAPGGAEDTPFSNEQANSGSLSMKLSSTAAIGGPSDIVWRLGNRTSGTYGISWQMYIPSGFGGYFNLQHNEVIGQGSWALDVNFRASGVVEYSVNSSNLTGQFPHNQWFNVAMVIDLGSMTGVLSINGTQQTTWVTNVNSLGAQGMNQFGAVNFYAYAGGDQTRYYIDDVIFVDVTGVGVAEQAAKELLIYPNPATDVVFIEHAGGPTAVASVVDLTGRTVIDGRTLGAGRGQLDLSGLPGGVYFLRIQEHGREQVRRITKR
jgi:hypothetical protein